MSDTTAAAQALRRQLLPPNASALERALADCAQLPQQPEIIATLWSSNTSPAPVLPWLAWALSVDQWDSTWAHTSQRQAIAQSVALHRKKGTAWAVEQALVPLGIEAHITAWFDATPSLPPYTFRLDARTSQSLSAHTLAALQEAIDNNKSARSHLHALRLTLHQSGQLHLLAAQAGADITTVQPLPAQAQPVSAQLAPVAALALGELARLYPPAAQPAPIAARTYRISAMVLREHTAVRPTTPNPHPKQP